MPYAKNDGVEIYYEIEGQGPPLVLAYGLTGGLNCWRMIGISDVLKDNFQLILFDARGHGKSDKPHEKSAYGISMADDVISVLDDIGIDTAHYFGYSLGAKIGYWLAVHYHSRFESFVLGGNNPYRNEIEIKLEDELREEMHELLIHNESLLKTNEKLKGRPLTEAEKDTLLVNDAQALLALVESFGDVPSLTDDELSKITVPVMVFCGGADPRYVGARESVNHMPNAEFLSLPDFDHIQADVCIMHNNVVQNYVNKFLDNVK